MRISFRCDRGGTAWEHTIAADEYDRTVGCEMCRPRFVATVTRIDARPEFRASVGGPLAPVVSGRVSRVRRRAGEWFARTIDSQPSTFTAVRVRLWVASANAVVR